MKESMKNVFPLSFGEEVGNSVSHGVMALLLLFALPYYAIRAYLQAGALHATGISIFIICMIFMFLGSCLYHSMPHDTTHKLVFRKLDHIMILLAIAGTYTPVCLSLMNNWIGYTVLAIEWLMVIAGVLLKSISNTNHKVLSMTIYMTMGWMAIFILPALIQKCSPAVLLINLSWRHTLYDRNLFLRTSTKKVQSLRMAHFYHSGIYLPLDCDSLFYDLGT